MGGSSSLAMVRVESTDILHKHPTKMKHVSLFPHRCWTWRLATSMTLIHIAVFDASGQEAPSFANAQGSPGANYLQLRQAMEQWIASHPDEETEESELRAEFTRWDWFWSRRVGSGEGEPGALEPYREAIAAFTATPVCERSDQPKPMAGTRALWKSAEPEYSNEEPWHCSMHGPRPG